MDVVRPIYPLPEELTACNRNETVCQYCGVSYLIHHEIKKLEEEIWILEEKLKFNSDLPQKYRSLQEDLNDKDAQLVALRSSSEVEKDMQEKSIESLSDLLQKRENQVELLENNFRISSRNFQKLVKELCSTSEQLLETKIQMEKMKGKIQLYDHLRKEIDPIKENGFNTVVKLLREKRTSESLKVTVDYFQEISDVAQKHIKQLESHIVVMTKTNEDLSRKLSAASVRLKELKDENERLNNKELEDVKESEITFSKMEELYEQNEALISELNRTSRENERLFSEEKKTKKHNCLLLSERDEVEIEINEIKSRESLLQESFYDAKTNLEKLLTENDSLRLEVNASNGRLANVHHIEHDLLHQIEEGKSIYENKICQLQHSFEKQNLELKCENDYLKEAVVQESQAKLERQEQRLKQQHREEVEKIETQLRQNMIDSQQNEQNIHWKWNAKLMEYREQMKIHVVSLEKQIELSSSSTLSRVNQLFREREELKKQVECLEQQLRECRRQHEMELLDKVKKLDELQQERKRDGEDVEHMKLNLIQKEKIIDVLQQTVYRECAERSGILKRLDELKKTGDSSVCQNSTNLNTQSGDVADDSESGKLAFPVIHTRQSNGMTANDNQDRIHKQTSTLQSENKAQESNNLSRTKSPPCTNNVTSNALSLNVPVRYVIGLNKRKIRVPAYIKNLPLNDLSSPSSTATQKVHPPRINNAAKLINVANCKNVSSENTKPKVLADDKILEFIVGKGKQTQTRNIDINRKRVKVIHKNSLFHNNAID